MSDRQQTTICITGASGYLGSYIVAEALERGYRVNATVRDVADTNKTAHLERLSEGRPGELRLFPANLLQPRSFDAAIDGCSGVLHVAAVARLAAKDPQREIVDPAVEGVRHVLDSVARARCVRRIVLTSSVAAVVGEAHTASHVHDESDWCADATLQRSPYSLAKARAERLFWERTRPDGPSMVSVNPSMVVGPVLTRAHARGSVSVVRDMLRGKFPACPQIYLNLVDVRDVARAHLEALERERATGRYIISARGMWMQELAVHLRAAAPTAKISARRMPTPLMYAMALFDKRLSFSFLRNNLGKPTRFSSSRARRELGLHPLPVERSLADTCRSMLELGLVPS